MRTILMGNRRLAVEVAEVLRRHDALAGVVLPPPDRREDVQPLTELDVPVWEWPAGLDQIRRHAPEVLLSVNFEYRLPPEWLAVASRYPLNLHLGLLPHNRGRAPHIWPLMDGSPSGVSLHVMDDGVDAGPILVQAPVPDHPEDTGGSTLARLEAVALALVESAWPGLADVVPQQQPAGGSRHDRADLESLALTDADLAVVDRLRALTGPRAGAEFSRGGRRYRVRVSVEPVD